MDKGRFYTNRRNIVLLAILCCALWGSAFPCVKVEYSMFKIAQEDIASKLILAGYRFTMAGIFVLIFQMIAKKKIFQYNKKEFGEITLLGIAQTAIQYGFFYVGMSYASGISGSIVNGTGTFFSVIIAHFVYKNDRINFNKALGCIVGFLGVVIVNLRGDLSLNGGFRFIGEGFIILAAFITSASGIYGKKISQNKDASIVTGYQLFIGGAILTICGFIFNGRLYGFNFKSTLLLIYMALLSSVAFSIWSELLKYNKVGNIAMFNFLTPVFGTLFSGIFLGENIWDIRILIALVLVCLGIFLVYRVKGEKDVTNRQTEENI